MSKVRLAGKSRDSKLNETFRFSSSQSATAELLSLLARSSHIVVRLAVVQFFFWERGTGTVYNTTCIQTERKPNQGIVWCVCVWVLRWTVENASQTSGNDKQVLPYARRAPCTLPHRATHQQHNISLCDRHIIWMYSMLSYNTVWVVRGGHWIHFHNDGVLLMSRILTRIVDLLESFEWRTKRRLWSHLKMYPSHTKYRKTFRIIHSCSYYYVQTLVWRKCFNRFMGCVKMCACFIEMCVKVL